MSLAKTKTPKTNWISSEFFTKKLTAKKF